MRSISISKVALALCVVLVLAGVSFAGVKAYMNDPKRDTPLVYSQNAMLLELWSDYKANNIEQGTNRTLDKQQDNITTSEGQSYTMLRSVWTDDRDTFDKSWQWTKDNLQRDDKLLSWKFGKLPDGKYGIQDTIGGQNTASDGDSDVALSLLMAYYRWNDSAYLYDAKPIIAAMWEKEVVTINGKPVFVSNDLEREKTDKVIVNPSYFSPYAYKIFAKVDPTHNWQGLADNSYTLLTAVSEAKLDASSSSGLPPDWVSIDRSTGAIAKADPANLTTNYSFDAFRTSWRLALDYHWFKDERAKTVLEKFAFLNTQWENNGKLATSYSHGGSTIDDYETPAAYGGAIGYFKVVQPETAKKVYADKLQNLYDPNEQKWKAPKAYYDDNWAWFGMALMEDALPNLTEQS